MGHTSHQGANTQWGVRFGGNWTLQKKEVGIPTGKPSNKVVGMPNRQTECASQQVLLPIKVLSIGSRLGNELPSLKYNSLVSVQKLADYGYTVVFKPGQEGVDVYKSGDIEIVTKAETILSG